MIRLDGRALWWRYRAYQRRAAGQYNKQTLACFWRAYHYSATPRDLVAYLSFRRDLGLHLPKRLVPALLAVLSQLPHNSYLRACALLAEHGVAIGRLCDQVDITALQMPALLGQLARPAGLTAFQQSLLSFDQQQLHWRALLARNLQDAIKQEGICVVGNAGFMQGLSLGKAIDQHSRVIRFNHYGDHVEDLGARIDVHTVTVGVNVAQTQAPWVVLSGPDLRYRLLDWSAFAGLQYRPVPVITVPLNVWQVLVKELAAPPSAGMTFLCFLWSMLGSWQGVTVAGFAGLQDERVAGYHITNPKQKASKRHNWYGERIMLKRWLKQGLSSLHG